jgi:hypothetical protein
MTNLHYVFYFNLIILLCRGISNKPLKWKKYKQNYFSSFLIIILKNQIKPRKHWWYASKNQRASVLWFFDAFRIFSEGASDFNIRLILQAAVHPYP